MARKLGDENNTVVIQDNLSDSEITLHYRMPTTTELTAYSNGMVVRRGNKLKRQVGEMRQKYGARILIGVGPDSFERREGGKWLPVISDPAAAGFDKDWKSHVVDQAPDIIEALAVHVFETSVQLATPDDDDDDDDEGDDAAKN